MRLDEAAIRAKVIELFRGLDHRRMDMWLLSGISAGVIDADIAERVMNEEIHNLHPDIQDYWLGAPCNCHGQLN